MYEIIKEQTMSENLDKSRVLIDRINGLTSELSGKQPTLVSGENIKTINSNSILGNGNIDINPVVDGNTINNNSSNQLQAIGLINKNTATGAVNKIYDWVGTLAEYKSQNIGTTHPTWICYITDDVEGGIDVYTKAEINGLLASKQSTTNLVTSVSSSSTDSQYPSAKLFYDTCGDIETLINAL